jgi:hypothetical protein
MTQSYTRMGTTASAARGISARPVTVWRLWTRYAVALDITLVEQLEPHLTLRASLVRRLERSLADAALLNGIIDSAGQVAASGVRLGMRG